MFLFLRSLFYHSRYCFLVLFRCSYLGAFSQYLISPFTIVYKHMLILLLILNLKMTVGRSTGRSFLTLTFIVNPFQKRNDNNIHLYDKYTRLQRQERKKTTKI